MKLWDRVKEFQRRCIAHKTLTLVFVEAREEFVAHIVW